MKKTIAWVTADYFLQVDMPVLPALNKEFNIHWFVIFNKNGRVNLDSIYTFAEENDITLTIIENSFHRFNPLIISLFVKLVMQMKKVNPDIFYLNTSIFPYSLFVLWLLIDKKRSIIAMHHGQIHEGMQFGKIYNLYLKLAFRVFNNFQFFSKSQAKYYPAKLKNKRVQITPLALSSYGDYDEEISLEKVHFLFFGSIIKNKNLELLLEASTLLFQEIGNNFHITIAGHCSNWDLYKHRIKYPDVFTLKISVIADNDIPSLFCNNHYLILPYSAVTQSGPLRIAYSYNTPVIASDLEGFTDSVMNGQTGLLFKANDVEDLKRIMKEQILGFPKNYLDLKQKQNKYIHEHLSNTVIIENYIKMFEKI